MAGRQSQWKSLMAIHRDRLVNNNKLVPELFSWPWTCWDCVARGRAKGQTAYLLALIINDIVPTRKHNFRWTLPCGRAGARRESSLLGTAR
jgi:hypothetical protein